MIDYKNITEEDIRKRIEECREKGIVCFTEKIGDWYKVDAGKRTLWLSERAYKLFQEALKEQFDKMWDA